MKKRFLAFLILGILALAGAAPAPNYDFGKIRMEKLGRGVIAVRMSADEVGVGWRYLSRDAKEIAFNVYRDGKKCNADPIRKTTFFVDANRAGGTYAVRPVDRNGRELPERGNAWVLPADAPVGYVDIPLDKPADGVTPAGETYTYWALRASVGDVDGDGEYEIILRWSPSNAHDNAHDGYTGNVYVDCYKLTGKRLWRIDLGRNIRAGYHYNQIIVYDLDHDGIAEIVMKTADGTVDGVGNVIGDAKADWRIAGRKTVTRGKDGKEKIKLGGQGRILDGPEFLTVFSGRDGKALTTVDYIPARGKITDWGDAYGNRCDRFLAAVAYLDGVRPSVVMCRGYYTRSVLVAFDWDGKELRRRWLFDTNDPKWSDYAGQGNHNLQVGDVDGDGCDEIVYGSMTVNHDGTGLYNTRLGHGDRITMTKFSPDFPGLQVWQCHESGGNGVTFRDAATGKIRFQHKNNRDTEPAIAFDMDPRSPGVEMWAANLGIFNTNGKLLANPPKTVIDMVAWWDGDLLREAMMPTAIAKYDGETRKFKEIMTFEGCDPGHRQKASPVLLGDLYGDWREEVLMRSKDHSALRLYVSTTPTEYRFHTFLEDPVYRLGVAHASICYSQPPHPGFYFGPDLIGRGMFRGTEL